MLELKKNKKANLDRYRGMFFNIGLVVSLGCLLLLFEVNFRERSKELTLNSKSADYEEVMDIPVSEQPPPPPPTASVKTINIISVPDFEDIEEEIQIQLDIDITEETKIEELEYVEELEIPEIPEEEVTEEIFTLVEDEPFPQGGYEAFYKYVFENLKYPQKAIRLGIEGRVFVQFVVGKDGSISDAVVIRGIDPECDAEAVRVITSAPKWSPGKQRGRPVNVRKVIPINFIIIHNGTDYRN